MEWDECITDYNNSIKTLLNIKAKSSDINQIMAIKNQINFIHSLLLMKDKLKNLRRVRMNWMLSWTTMNQSYLDIISDIRVTITTWISEGCTIYNLSTFYTGFRLELRWNQ
jgi:hypothetical protein